MARWTWLNVNKLTLTSETKIASRITFSEILEISVHNAPAVKQVTTTKSLGLLIDDNLTWRPYIA